MLVYNLETCKLNELGVGSFHKDRGNGHRIERWTFERLDSKQKATVPGGNIN